MANGRKCFLSTREKRGGINHASAFNSFAFLLYAVHRIARQRLREEEEEDKSKTKLQFAILIQTDGVGMKDNCYALYLETRSTRRLQSYRQSFTQSHTLLNI